MSFQRNALWNLAGLGVPLVAGALLIPYLLRAMGVEAFGVLTLVWALIGYFSLFDFGLGRALTQQVAWQLATGDHRALPGRVKSGLLLALATGLLGGVVLAVFAWPLGTHVLKVSPPMREAVFHALLLAAVGVPVTTATVGLRGVLEAYEDFRDVNILRMLLGVTNFGLPALSVWCLGPSLVAIVFGLTVARLVLGLWHWQLVRRRVGLDFWRAPLRRAHVQALLSVGAWMTVSSVVSPLMVTADRFVISATLGAAIVAYYTVPSEVMARLLILPGALTGVLFPRLSALLANDRAAAQALYHRCVVAVGVAMLPLCLVAGFFAHPLLSAWLGEAFADRSAPVVSILAIGLLLNGVAFVPFAAVQAAGHAHITAKLHLLEAVFYFPMLMWALGRFGIAGAALAWTVRVGIDLALLAWAAHHWVFHESRREVASAALRHNFGSIDPQRTETP
ncbi:flippase [Variovorax ginsengisoli]|uniref:O-antigen/teichoic acid export membrane protein n=1 Tax=Variovorax ginsengisoli TaxID=363844 RepID=A0ABT9SCD7_9BURK|nr:flippase [Variovorax ginsengisoli]MDP9901579.1 O-antigen/teichoic acid export membrane protein [Variovorax ginsengisoli]